MAAKRSLSGAIDSIMRAMPNTDSVDTNYLKPPRGSNIMMPDNMINQIKRMKELQEMASSGDLSDSELEELQRLKESMMDTKDRNRRMGYGA
jgi:hypothetical protein